MAKGRPRNSADRQLPERLIAAFRSCLADKSHIGLTTAEIARAAGTHPNMITYYFGGKDGLQNAVSDAIIHSVNEELGQLERSFRSGELDGATGRFVRTMVEAYWQDRASASIWLIETFRPESRSIQFYRSRSGWRVLIRLSRMIKVLIDAGLYRANLDPTDGAISLLSLVIGPMTIRPAWQAKDVTYDKIDLERWIEHVTIMVKVAFERSQAGPDI